MCSFRRLTYFRVGTSRCQGNAVAECCIVELVRCGLLGSTGTACTGSRACRGRKTSVAGQSWRSEMVRSAQQFSFLGAWRCRLRLPTLASSYILDTVQLYTFTCAQAHKNDFLNRRF